MPRRRGALFLPLDTRFFEDDRIVAAGEAASWLFLAICCKAKQLETDGELTLTQVERLGVTSWRKRLDALVRENAIELKDGRVQVLAWLNHNDPSAKIADRRKKDAERKRVAAASEPLPFGIPTDSGTESEPTPNGLRPREGEGEGEGEETPPTPPAPPGGPARNPRALGTNPRGAKPPAAADTWTPPARGATDVA